MGPAELSTAELTLIKEDAAALRRLGRLEFIDTICEHMLWMTPSGRPKRDFAVRILSTLEDQGIISLPAKGISPKRTKRRAESLLGADERAPIIGKLKEIGQVTLEPVEGRADSILWDEYVQRHHFLGCKQAFGVRQKFFINSRRGHLGCFSVCGAVKRIKARDQWIGWTQRQREHNLHLVLYQNRYLLFPWVKVRYLASHVLGMTARLLPTYWEERWGYRPALLETFVDPNRHLGTCYLAANWIPLGLTTGMGVSRPGKSYKSSPKLVFTLPLEREFRSQLCARNAKNRRSFIDEY